MPMSAINWPRNSSASKRRWSRCRLLGLPVSSLSGGNVADQVARHKGEQQTLRQVMTEKRCAMPQPATTG